MSIMGMGYGDMYVRGDYKGDLEFIVRVMNRWDWGDGFDTKFEVIGSSIVPKLGWAEYPTALARCYVRDDGTPIPYNEIDEEEELETKNVELETISREISPLLKSGMLRVAAEFDDCEGLCVTNLQISSDGRVEETSVFFCRHEAELEDVVEKWVYEPKCKSTLEAFM